MSVYVGGVGPEDEESVRAIFSRYGKLKSVVFYRPTNKFFVNFYDQQACVRAQKDLDMVKYNGNILTVSMVPKKDYSQLIMKTELPKKDVQTLMRAFGYNPEIRILKEKSKKIGFILNFENAKEAGHVRLLTSINPTYKKVSESLGTDVQQDRKIFKCFVCNSPFSASNFEVQLFPCKHVSCLGCFDKCGRHLCPVCQIEVNKAVNKKTGEALELKHIQEEDEEEEEVTVLSKPPDVVESRPVCKVCGKTYSADTMEVIVVPCRHKMCDECYGKFMPNGVCALCGGPIKYAQYV